MITLQLITILSLFSLLQLTTGQNFPQCLCVQNKRCKQLSSEEIGIDPRRSSKFGDFVDKKCDAGFVCCPIKQIILNKEHGVNYQKDDYNKDDSKKDDYRKDDNDSYESKPYEKPKYDNSYDGGKYDNKPYEKPKYDDGKYDNKPYEKPKYDDSYDDVYDKDDKDDKKSYNKPMYNDDEKYYDKYKGDDNNGKGSYDYKEKYEDKKDKYDYPKYDDHKDEYDEHKDKYDDHKDDYDDHDDKYDEKYDDDSKYDDNYGNNCGYRYTPHIDRRIVSSTGDSEAEPGYWPWQAAILKESHSNYHLFKSSGVVIDQHRILTVAHNVDKFKGSELLVRLGEHNITNGKSNQRHQDIIVKKIVIHPRFDDRLLYNDIAVICLRKPIRYNENVANICLPSSYGSEYENNYCTVTGWGKESYHGGSYSNVLRQVDVRIRKREQCNKLLIETKLGRGFRLHPSFICAGGDNHADACKGDGGGPLSCKQKDGSYQLAGLVSWGIDCGHEGVPGIYTNIKHAKDWIDSVKCD